MQQEFNWDLFVIGAGSGGLAAAKRAAAHGQKVAIADFVKPSPQGTTWGIGGTCVNVGCIPKKLMHFAALTGHLREDMKECGWDVDASKPHDWTKMLENVNNYIKGLNWGYKKALIKAGVKIFTKLASLENANTIVLDDGKGNTEKVTAKRILIAVGGRPTYLDVPGSREYCISSDDLFWMKNPPGKTLVIGAGYIAMECGGFTNGMGHETFLMVRSTPLRNFDQDMVKKVVEDMNDHGVTFLMKCEPIKFEKHANGKIQCTWRNSETKEEFSDFFDTVLQAIGRYADTKQLGLDNVGVKHEHGKIIVDKDLKTTVDNIYAIGDVCKGSPELTPVAIKEGLFLCDRLYANGNKRVNYDQIPTTIFTPLEYSAMGFSEEKAIEKLGKDNVEVYHTSFKPLEWNFLKSRKDNLCYVKLVVDKSKDEKIVGFHYAGPNAGEVLQGYAVAITAGLTKQAFDDTLGIHPTCSEEVVQLTIKKSEQAEVVKEGC